MLEIIERYTEDRYCDKETISRTFDASNANIIWEETKRYRRQFKYALLTKPYQCHITLCRNVMFGMMECERQLYRYSNVMKNETVSVQDVDTTWDFIELHYRMGECVTLKEWAQDAIKRLCLEKSSLCEYLLLSEEPFVLRLFLCFYVFEDEVYKAIRLLTIKEHMSEMLGFLCTLKLDKREISRNDSDATYAFLWFLEQLQLKISEGMVLLSRDLNVLKCTMDFASLKECYPQVSSVSLTFYESHRSAHRYYTIQQFMEHGNVCYETARNAMDKLVEMQWYQKRKIGKKYVYFIYEKK